LRAKGHLGLALSRVLWCCLKPRLIPESEFRVPVRHISPAVVVKHKDPPAKKDADIASDLTKWVLRGSGVPPDEDQIVGKTGILV
jgi:hypothetical protein